MIDDLDIEPDDPMRPGVLEQSADLTVLAPFLPPSFPILTLLRFLPDVRLKHRANQLAVAALAVDVAQPGGLVAADAALSALRPAIDAIETSFDDPVRLANQLHKRLTGLRTDFTAQAVEAADIVGKRIYDEKKRLDRLARDAQQRAQEQANAEARRQAEQAAREAAARKAPKEIVAALKDAATTTVAPPVASPAPAPVLRGTATVERWKARFAGTPDDMDPNPAMADLTPAQQAQARVFFRAVADGKIPLVCAGIDWPEVNRRAHAERTTFVMAGLDAFDAGGVRKKGR